MPKEREKLIHTIKSLTKKDTSGNPSDPKRNNTYYVVYLDDESNLLKTAAEIIEQFGLTPFTTTSMNEAIQFIEAHHYHIIYIISDYKIGNYTGFDFREAAAKISAEVPFAILSAYISKGIALKGVELNISAFIDKPISIEKFADVLSKHGLPRIQTINEDQELLQGFIEESEDRITQAEELALSLENNPQDLDSVNKIFGIVHTLKGASGFFKPKTLHQFIHRFEDTLKSIQREEISLNETVISTILNSFDFIKILMSELRTRTHQPYDLDSIFQSLFSFDTHENKSEFTPLSPPNAANPPKLTQKKAIDELRVPVTLLDDFMGISGEITVIRNMINKCVKSIEAQYSTNRDVQYLSKLLNELHKLNSQMQNQVSSLRRISLQQVLKPIPRAIRDLSKSLNKSIEYVFKGEQISVDMSVAGVLTNSVIHLVRNSLDHGIESPENRIKLGKPEKGSITISSHQKDDITYVSISDDGRGLNEDAIRKKLVKNGSHTEAQAVALKRDDLFAMIFSPGFSTAETVTDISGRGIGMNVVKDAVESIGGRIEIESFPQKGTTFRLVLPVPKSVLIQNCLFVSSEEMLFGIPQSDIGRVIHIGEHNRSLIRPLGQDAALEYENHLIPIVNLSSFLKTTKQPHSHHSISKIVVVESKRRRLAICVDQILDIEDTVVKKLEGPVKNIHCFQGAAFLADSTIALVLSVEGLLDGLNISPQFIDQTKPLQNDQTVKHEEVLSFRTNQPRLLAIPTHYLARIEEIHRNEIQMTGGINVISYRNQILPLVNLNSLLMESQAESSEVLTQPDDQSLTLLILKHQTKTMGVLVHSIEEIIRLNSPIVPEVSKQFGRKGNAFIDRDHTVTILDVEEIFLHAWSAGQ